MDFVQANGAYASNTNVTATLSAAPQEGNWLYAFCGTAFGIATDWTFDTEGWNPVADSIVEGATTSGRWYRKFVGADELNTVTATCNPPNIAQGLVVVEYSGDGTLVYDTSIATGSGTSLNSGSVSARIGDTIVAGKMSQAVPGTTKTWGGLFEPISGTNNIRPAAAHRLNVETETTYSTTWTHSADTEIVMSTLSIGPGANNPPSCSAGANAEVTVNDEFTRVGTDSDDDGSIVNREWFIASGPTSVGNTLSTVATLTWTPTMVGTYLLKYRVTDDDGAIAENSMELTVIPPPDLSGLFYWDGTQEVRLDVTI